MYKNIYRGIKNGRRADNLPASNRTQLTLALEHGASDYYLGMLTTLSPYR